MSYDNDNMPLDADPLEVAASVTNDQRADYGKKREPLLSDEQLSGVVVFPGGGKRYETEMDAYEVRNIYEASRAKDAEFIKQLLLVNNAILEWWEDHKFDTYTDEDEEYNAYDEEPEMVKLAKAAAGFKPSEP